MSEHQPEAKWRPLLDGDLRRRALDAIDAIARDLRDPPAASDHPDVPEQQRAIDEICLGRGRAGLALFYGFKALVDDDEGARSEASRYLEEAFDGVARLSMSSSLFVGFSGVAWAAEILEHEVFRTGNDPNEDIDDVLLAFVDAGGQADYDLISGWVGVGAYCLERSESPAAAKCLEIIVNRLAESADITDAGTAWFTPPEMLPSATRDEFPEGFYNLGMAHGIVGIIALLAGAYANGIAKEKGRLLLHGAIDWMLAQRIAGDDRSAFPAVVAPGRPAEPSRTAWCYGDPGIAAALSVAAQATSDSGWRREAVGIATAAARRPVELCGVDDAGLCHGAAGLAHVLNRVALSTGDRELEDAAREWFERALDMRRPDTGIAGYRTWRSGRGGYEGWIDHPGLLTGAAGIGLALLAACSSIEPSWDRCLLLSIRPSVVASP
jgi:lantibiotic modifying enzyme